MFSSNMIFDFYLISGLFLTFCGPNVLFFGIEKRFKTGFGVYLCSITTFILFDLVNSDI